MKVLAYILMFCVGTNMFHGSLYSQEEESAAVSLEDNTDVFQERFFEALKQKGIENYDKAINLLLECKQLEPGNPVVDHELARAYQASGQPMKALEYGMDALNADPANFWYLETMVVAALQQGNTLEMIKTRIPYGNAVLRENLARVYYKLNNYQAALDVLKDVTKTAFTQDMQAKIRDSMEQKTAIATLPAKMDNPMETLRDELNKMLEQEAYEELEERSMEALEQYPSVPFFYYMRGLAYIHGGNFKAAVQVMEEGLDYLLDDVSMAEKMYRALAKAYNALGNTSKANMYLSKIKSGS